MLYNQMKEQKEHALMVLQFQEKQARHKPRHLNLLRG